MREHIIDYSSMTTKNKQKRYETIYQNLSYEQFVITVYESHYHYHETIDIKMYRKKKLSLTDVLLCFAQ